MTLVSEARKMVIFLAEKCASTSVREALVGHEDWERIQGPLVMKPEWEKDYFKIGFTRNPYDRMVSYWLYWTRIGVCSYDFDDCVFKQDIPDHAKSISNWYRGVRIDGWIDVDNLQQSFDRYGLGVTFSKLNTSDCNSPYEDYYKNDNVYALVTAWAADDFKYFGFRLRRFYKKDQV